MDKNDVLKLVNAGFSKQEILDLFLDKTSSAEDQEAKTKSSPLQKDSITMQEESDSSAKESPDLNALSETLDNKFNEILGKFDTMLQKIQDANLQGSRQPDKPGTEDVLASIINPKL